MLKGDVKVEVLFDSPGESRTIYEALKPELSASPSERTKVNATHRDKTVALTFRGRDFASLRASINSYMRWMMAALAILAIKRSD